MKHSKTLMLAALVASSLLTGGLAAHAQESTNAAAPAGTPPAATPPATGGRMRGMNFDNAVKQLNLTDDEKPKVQAVLDDVKQKFTDLRADSSLSPADRRAKFKEIRDDMNAKLKDILTPDQYAQWQKIGPGNRRPPGLNPASVPAVPAATPAPATPPPQ